VANCLGVCSRRAGCAKLRKRRSSSGNGGGSGGSTGAAGGGGAAGALGGTGGCDKDLTGTWDLLATSVGGGPSSGIMILGVEGFTVATNGGQLIYTATGTKSATWATSGSRRTIGVQNTPASLNGGSIPVVLGGHWVLSTAFETCTLDVAAGTIRGRCNGRPGDYSVARRLALHINSQSGEWNHVQHHADQYGGVAIRRFGRRLDRELQHGQRTVLHHHAAREHPNRELPDANRV